MLSSATAPTVPPQNTRRQTRHRRLASTSAVVVVVVVVGSGGRQVVGRCGWWWWQVAGRWCLGKQDNVHDLLPLADLYAHAQRNGIASVFAGLEAMACRVPSISTNVGGVPELIENGVNGLLFEVGDVDGMSTAAIDLLSDHERLEKISSASAAAPHRITSALPASSHFTKTTTGASSTVPTSKLTAN